MESALFSGFNQSIPFHRALSMIRNAGFSITALGGCLSHMDYTIKENLNIISTLLRNYDLRVDSVHAPFPEADYLFSLDKEEREKSIQHCKFACDAANAVESSIVVLHIVQPYDIKDRPTQKKMEEEGKKSIESLIRYAERRNVKLALENGQRPWYDEVLTAFLKEFNSPQIGFCYDSGHAHVQGSSFSLLKEFHNRLLTVHIHDNPGKDSHLLPYEGTIDWDEFKKIFHTINYSGSLLLEPHMANSRFTDPVYFLKEAKKRGDKLLTLPTR